MLEFCLVCSSGHWRRVYRLGLVWVALTSRGLYDVFPQDSSWLRQFQDPLGIERTMLDVPVQDSRPSLFPGQRARFFLQKLTDVSSGSLRVCFDIGVTSPQEYFSVRFDVIVQRVSKFEGPQLEPESAIVAGVENIVLTVLEEMCWILASVCFAFCIWY